VILQARSFDLCVHQDADQVVGRLRLAASIIPSCIRCSRKGLHGDLDVRFGRSAAQRADQVVGPLEEHLAFFGAHAEHVTDDGIGSARRDPDEVALAAFTYGSISVSHSDSILDPRSLTRLRVNHS